MQKRIILRLVLPGWERWEATFLLKLEVLRWLVSFLAGVCLVIFQLLAAP